VNDSVAALGAHLRASGFDEDGITAALGDVLLWKAKAMGAARPPLVPEPLATLVTLFHVRLPVPREQAEAALAPVTLEALAAEGLLEIADGLVSACYQVTWWLGILVLHDSFDVFTVQPDHVLGGSRAAETLARGTIRVPTGRALDLGCASGVQALLASAHADHVVATDVNPRAVHLVRVNARLNGVGNVEAREGSWFEPVADERFDLIVANPPYVISPDNDLLYRDGSEEGDSLSRNVVRGVAEHLAPGGLGHVLCNWALEDGATAYGPVGEWVDGLGCDAYVLNFGPEGVVSYASRWNEHLALADPEAYPVAVGRWLEDYRKRGIETIVFGLVVLRRRVTGQPWFRTLEVRGGTTGFGGAQLLRAVEGLDFLTDLGAGGRLLDERFVLVEGHQLTHRMAFQGGEYRRPAVTLSHGEGIGVAADVDPEAVMVLEVLDGERPLSEVIAAVAAEQGRDPRELTDATLETARRLLQLGLLERR
jgi:methylase of polypeptide subunit release factors